jgi:two-component system cell cycle sensor histidine kinase/response regulator CckA
MKSISSERGRVLIVDDDQKILDLLVELLMHEGYEVSSATNGAEGLQQARLFDPDVVVSDVVMPLIGGLELCRKLKEDEQTAYIPVLLISGILRSDEDGLEGLNAGADDYLDIPFRNEELLVKVTRLVERHRIEKHYREIVEQAADIIYTRDMDGYLTSMNASGAHFFGRKTLEMRGRHLTELIGSESAAQDISATKNHQGAEPLRSTYSLPDAKGEPRHLEGVITVQRDRHGNPIGVRGVVRDITDQKLAEQALKESEERYRQLVDLSPNAIVVHSEGKFNYLNQAAVTLWGANDAADLIGQSIMSVVHPDFRGHVAEQVDYIQQFQKPTSLAEQKCVRLDGAVIDVEVAGIPFTFNGKRGVQAVFRDVTEQKQAREALRKAEKRLRTVVGSAPLILLATDKNGIFTLCEGEGLKSLLLKPGELVGKSIFEVYAHSTQAIANARRALAGESFASAVEFGELVFDVRYSPLTDEADNILGMIGVATDITESRRAEASLRESEARSRELFENANDIIYTHDLAGNFTSLNRAGERITGYSREEAALMNVSDVIAPEYLGLAREMISHKASANPSTVYEIDIISKAGRRVRLEVSTRLIYREGKAIGVQGIARDLTERKHSEEALRESQAFFNNFMDNSPAVAFMKDADGRYVYVNKPFERLFGQKLTYLKGRKSFDWLPPIIAADTHEHDLKVLQTGKPEEVVETVPTEDGSPHHWLVFKFPTIDSAGNRFVAGVGVDITARRRAEEALEQQAEREAMTHRISQTIRCSLDSREIFQTAVRELGSHLEVDRCSLFMRNEDRKCATNVAEFHAEGVQPAASDFALSHLQALVKALDQTGVLPFADAAHDPRIVDLYENILSKADVKSIMYVAIRVGDDVPAAFALSTTRQLRDWSEADIALAKAVADQTGIAIRQAELYQKAESTSIREALVNRLTMAIRASLSLPEVLSTATRELGGALDASRVHLYLHQGEGLTSPLEHEYLAPGIESIKDVEVTYDDPIGKRLVNTLQPLIVRDAVNFSAGSPAFNEYVQAHAAKLGAKSQIVYPLIVKGQFRGVLCIHQTDYVRHWTQDELDLVEALAERLAIGIAQAELFEMVARGKSEWETTFDAMSDGIFIFDRSGELKRVNQAGATMEAEHPRALLGRKCCDILRTSDEDETCVVERALESGGSVTIEVTPNRLNRPLLVTIEPVLGAGGIPSAVVCTARDLSELRKVQAVAREHQSLLTNILESARESIYAVDPDGRFKWCNSATLKGLGYQRSDFIGRPLLEMVYETDRELVQEKLDLALTGLPQTYEMRYFAHDGQLRHARVDNSPLVVEGRTTGVLGIARDITEQKEERERAARADKLRALGQLASGVAHDFNNSLAAILGRAQLLRRQISEPPLIRNLDIIQTAAEDAAATVRRIQTFARKSPVKEFEMLDVRSLLHDAIEITRTRWENEARLRGLEYDVSLNATGNYNTYGSASELREVFVNLIVNAVDAMPRGGKLAITCQHHENRLLLRFTDNGMGMPEDVKQKIFEPFFSTKGAHGTGLGLSVSYSIIERHEGAIAVSSEPGNGTTFTIDLPAVVAESSFAGVLESVDEMPSLRVLVIDDEEAVRETLADMLIAGDHKVEMVESGHDAVARLRRQSFDFVFTDLAMPEMDGWETARAIRKEWPEIKIVLVTGYGPNTTPPPGEEDLVDGIIGKPFDFAQVGSTLSNLVAQAAELEKIGV